MNSAVRYDVAHPRMAGTRKTVAAEGGVGKLEPPRALLVGSEPLCSLWKVVWFLLQQLNTELPRTQQVCSWRRTQEKWNLVAKHVPTAVPSSATQEVDPAQLCTTRREIRKCSASAPRHVSDTKE